MVHYIDEQYRTSRVSRLLLLYNGVSVRLLSLSGDNHVDAKHSSAELRIALETVRVFFTEGTTAQIEEVGISRAAIDSIVEANHQCHCTPTPLVRALSELLNFCRDLGNAAAPHTAAVNLPAPTGFQSPRPPIEIALYSTA